MAETVGSLIDKLCINKLKIYHTNKRLSAESDEAARENFEGRLMVLREQGEDLNDELQELLHDLAAGKKHLKVYRQYKM